MKNNKKTAKWLTFLFSVLVMVALATPSFATLSESATPAESVTCAINEPFVFSLQPGNDEWAEFESTAEIVALLQVPEYVLSEMSTPALLETVLNYPYILMHFAFNCPEIAFRRLYEDFNGFRELFGRSDLSETLVRRYANASVLSHCQYVAYMDENRYVRPEDFFYTSTLEFLILGDMMHNGVFDESLLQEFIEIAQIHMLAREQSGLFSIASDVFERNQQNVIDLDAELSISPRVIAPGSIWTNSNVFTPRGASVPTLYNRRPELSIPERIMFSMWVRDNYPWAQEISGATVLYNCHSFAFHSQVGSRHWINSPLSNATLLAYIADGSYVLQSFVGNNMRAVWIQDDHSGIITGFSQDGTVWITSKWGMMGRYLHPSNHAPYSGIIRVYQRS